MELYEIAKQVDVIVIFALIYCLAIYGFVNMVCEILRAAWNWFKKKHSKKKTINNRDTTSK